MASRGQHGFAGSDPVPGFRGGFAGSGASRGRSLFPVFSRAPRVLSDPHGAAGEADRPGSSRVSFAVFDPLIPTLPTAPTTGFACRRIGCQEPISSRTVRKIDFS